MQELKTIYQLNQRILLLDLERTRDFDTKSEEIHKLKKKVKQLQANVDFRYDQENKAWETK